MEKISRLDIEYGIWRPSDRKLEFRSGAQKRGLGERYMGGIMNIWVDS